MENTQKEISKIRLPYFDFLKGISILAVIWIHCIYRQILTIPDGQEYILNFLNNLLRFTIPFFLILSGILLNPNETNWKQFYTKKLSRILIPYTLCVLAIGLLTQIPMKTIFLEFFTGRMALPYYFLLILFQMYFLYPLFLKWKKFVWFLPLMLGVSVCSFLIPQTWLFFGIPTSFQYLFFFAYGIAKREIFLSDNAQKQDLFSWIIMICIYISLLFVYPTYYYNTQYVYGPAMLHLAFIFQNKFHIHNTIGKCIESLGKNSLWIFLTHYLIVLLTYRFFQDTLHNYWGNFLFLMFIATISSITFAYIIEKIYSFAQKKLLP
ncbi:MAG: acyltransferase [Candidatus Magasanikbacteria bacterium]